MYMKISKLKLRNCLKILFYDLALIKFKLPSSKNERNNVRKQKKNQKHFISKFSLGIKERRLNKFDLIATTIFHIFHLIINN